MTSDPGCLLTRCPLHRHSLPGETEPLLTVPTSFLEAPEGFQSPPQVTVESELCFPDSVMDSDSGESTTAD